MTRDEARQILAAWPGTPESSDPAVREARALAERDPQLAEWLARHLAFRAGTTLALRELSPPPDLADRILAAHRVRPVRFGGPPGRWLALAAVVVGLALVAAWLAFGPRPPRPDDFNTFRSRMVRSTLREYRMDVVTNDLAAIRSFLSRRAAPADFELPGPLARATPVGGGVLRWQGHPVSMVCLEGGPRGMLYLFIVPEPAVAHGAPAASAELAGVNRLATASWTAGMHTYVLAADTALENLRPLL